MSDELIAKHRKVRDRDFGTNDIAHAALPILSHLRSKNPNVHAMIIGTGDGIHVCSIGFDSEDNASRMAALNSSMLGVSTAQAQVMDPLKDEIQDTVVAVQLPGSELLGLARIEHPPVGHLVLGVFGRDIKLGMVVHLVQTIAQALADWIYEG
ncbi:hypothetical protein N7326_07515 [Corynebacterium sp. ES2794-CONJ1]|uniref:hypothetical protein n=1 Tax=unclassified Corynebacterium TaxID=2624378 RepID=UPI002169A752|nr:MULTISPECIES: hypothetical protein [unclassified Corynebacterium]MCS4490415.1 hypothetical protein [Corynebacterium sp. ES2775-CONJ]MCS4492195.1 hypothetical protein [Corynebacterium sp. ES2715-CONJ3]MCS4532323.1 hypothetical protein [Corynebacterium sp. ES2730-CONJ]MCU9519714.1 hypothetical protein [Corynebacterium sp. ES2794-CONJ1]